MAELFRGAGPKDRQIGARIRERREFLGVSTALIARDLGCSEGEVLDHEAGRVRIRASALILLSQSLGVKVGYFLRSLAEDAPPPIEAAPQSRDETKP